MLGRPCTLVNRLVHKRTIPPYIEWTKDRGHHQYQDAVLRIAFGRHI
jgi:hypothetical protein